MADWPKHNLQQAEKITIWLDDHQYEMTGEEFVRCLESGGWRHTNPGRNMIFTGDIFATGHCASGTVDIIAPNHGSLIDITTGAAEELLDQLQFAVKYNRSAAKEK